MMAKSICPCGQASHPTIPSNPAGLDWLVYRAGDFASFRHALLLPRGEAELKMWFPGAGHDLAVMIAEFWAYIADILTFYNEQYVNEHYLTTAVRDEDVRRLVRLLGYRPRPGIGAVGMVAAILQGSAKVQVPVGFPILSKPAPGQSPQTFEVDAAATFSGASRIEADPAPGLQNTTSILLAGEVAGILPGEKLLLIAKNWPTTNFAAWATVVSAVTEKSPRDVKNTRITFTAPTGAPAADTLRLLRPNQAMGLYAFTANTVASANSIHLAGLAREAAPDTPIVLQVGANHHIAKVGTYAETIWYANATDANNPQNAPADPAVPVSIPHSLLTFTPDSPHALNANKTIVRVRYDWRDVGRPIPTPASTLTTANSTLAAATPTLFPAVTLGQKLLLEDASQAGSFATAAANQEALATLSVNGVTGTLKSPLRVLVHLLSVSRGKTVKNEVLGTGDATLSGQEFELKKSPLTYLPNTDPQSPDPYSSTLRLWVDNIEWKEVPSFFQQPSDAQIFVTRQDEDHKTHVMFGDGVNGARLPSGASVAATYRYESGAAIPNAGALSVLGSSLPGLTSVRNPVPPGGGDDPDEPTRLRELAPQSVLTFGRAVSGMDYEAIAAQAPGVTRARAYWSYDAVRQRTTVRVYVGDTQAAATSARNALIKAADPNRPLTVELASPRQVKLALTVAIDPSYVPEPVIAAVRDALLNDDTGLFGLRQARIGHVLFRSSIFAACLAVPGVVAVHQLQFWIVNGGFSTLIPGYRYMAGQGFYFQLAGADLTVDWEAPEA